MKRPGLPQMDIDRYFEQIVDPTIKDFEANPTSVRHAFLAAVAVFHTIDYAGLTSRVNGQIELFAQGTDNVLFKAWWS